MESNANSLPACMIAGAEFNPDGSITTWKSYDNQELLDKSIFTVKQDIRLLKNHAVKLAVDHIEMALKKNKTQPNDIKYFIPHLSSMFFYQELLHEIQERNIDLGEEKWFLNLTKVGNIGSASIFVALDELFKSGKLKKGDNILLLVPESGRFSYGTALLTVV